MTTILAADIGGTNSRFARFDLDASGVLSMGDSVWLPTAGSGSFGALLDMVRGSELSLKPEDADAVAVAIAGPVRGGTRSNPPNIEWTVDLGDSLADFGIRRCALVNDFAAQAYACGTEILDRALPVLPGRADASAPLGVIGAGTGLGMSLLVPGAGGSYFALPTEGGHALFPFCGEREFKYQEYLLARTRRRQAIGDMVLSGAGLSALHCFLTGDDLPAPDVAALLPGSDTLDWFAGFYGRACRNFALQTLAMGGICVSGGLAARNSVLATHDTFAREFRFSETHGALLADIPVYLNSDQDSGLWGAAFMAKVGLLHA